MVNLKAKPFSLEDSDIKWVEETLASMTVEEKIGQLFINLGKSRDPKYMQSVLDHHIGGVRYLEASAEEIYEQNKYYQEHAKIPVLIASNCETGGNGACGGGTLVATGAQCGACKTTKAAYDMGYVSGVEGTAVGCNWTFAPITDILFNWRNTIVNTRAFGDDVDKIIARSKAYIDGVHKSNMLACSKHFPGDGVEERDQHLVMGVNDLSCEEWDASFGKVYKELIESGLETMMVGHIALPSYSKKLVPGMKDSEVMPATLAPELLQGLLREQLGFNGLILTDASHMVGMTCARPRSEQVPGAIAAGCDMFLFFHDIDEDFNYMLEGYQKGIITEERLTDAVTRILGMKAKLKLHERKANGTLIPDKAGLKVVGCEEHHALAALAADESITLVKDTQNLLPINPSEKKRAKLYFIESAPVLQCSGTDKTRQLVVEELEKAGFEVDVNASLYDFEKEGSTPANRFKSMACETVEDLKEKYDVIFMFVHMKGYAQENNVRVRFSIGHSNEIPWWTKDVPTVCVSLNYTNHLYDLPMMQTYINAYAPTREVIYSTVQKIIGNSEFKGEYSEKVFCDRWDTRL